MNPIEEDTMKRECIFCHEEEAVFHVSTSQYENAVCRNSGGRICLGCLVCRLTNLPNAHHFIYRIDASYQPDGFNYDDGLILGVIACAKYRHKTVEEFMARGERLIEWHGDVE